MNKYMVKDIPRNSFFSKSVYIGDRFIVAAPETPFTQDIAQILLKWGFNAVESDGECRETYQPEEFTRSPEEEIIPTEVLPDREKLRRAEIFYDSFTEYVETLFSDMVIKNKLDFKEVAEKIKTVCIFIKEDRRFLLRVQRMAEPKPGQNYLATHAIKSTIIAIVIGYFIKLPYHRLIELGVAALLHEIGMTKLPPQIYSNKRALSIKERQAILTHPILSYNMLKSFDFPLIISIAALEHHERENGDGYPQKLTGDKISLYAKIIAVACSYEALTNHRPYKAAKDGYEGMLDLLKNPGKQYDETIIRALIFSLSIYPIGLYVLLSNGKKGQVIDVNPENPRFPVVQLLEELTPDGRNKTLETSQTGVHILRPLLREEINDPQKG
ncbi:HD-GYP domain-containing protein [Treponema sp. TIM-1]|uniref:HD-GYP domain-containing protein n=1 Tax=Treponema sp. TIM-1 TaxID=2898417 RepID=UPI00397EAD0A